MRTSRSSLKARSSVAKPAKAESLRRRADTLFRQLIRERDQWCQGDATLHQGGPCWGSLEVAHFHPRRHLVVRWDKNNAALLCQKSHRFMDEHEDLKWNFIGQRIGQVNLDLLRARRAEPWDGRQGYARVIEELKSDLRGWSLPGYLDDEPPAPQGASDLANGKPRPTGG